MKHEDVVTQASRALRDAYSGETDTATLARQRILTSVSRKSSKKRFRLFLGTPLLAVIVGGTAWAAQGGQLAAVWHTVANVLSSERSGTTASVRAVTTAPKQLPAAPAESLTDPPTEPAALEATALEATALEATALEATALEATALEATALAPTMQPEPTALEAAGLVPTVLAPTAPTGATTRSAERIPGSSPAQRARQIIPEPGIERKAASAVAQRKPEQAPVPEVATKPVAAPDLELVVFRKAHELHFSGNSPDSAVTAYRDYIRQFPSGRFVPEARYNVALNHVKLGNRALAREELTPFAEGRFGDYRKADAQRLLEVLR